MMLRVNRKHSLMVRVQNHRKEEETKSHQRRKSVTMKNVSNSWSLHSKQRGDY